MQLLTPEDPPAVELVRPDGRSDLFLTCDHAGNRVPGALGTLGLGAIDRQRHIAWDIGAAGVARGLAERVDACLVLQTYSRLVIDCNRPPGVPSSIATLSERTAIPANEAISAVEAEARRVEIFQPYHDQIKTALDRRAAEGRRTILIAVHSFTPTYMDVGRKWHVGVLYNKDPRFSGIVLELLHAEGDLVVGDNEPYSVSDLTDYTVPIHAEARGLPYLELEIRQDLIANSQGQQAWADRLARLLPQAAAQLG